MKIIDVDSRKYMAWTTTHYADNPNVIVMDFDELESMGWNIDEECPLKGGDSATPSSMCVGDILVGTNAVHDECGTYLTRIA